MTKRVKPSSLERLKKFLDQNQKIDPKTLNLSDAAAVTKLNWKGLTRYKQHLVPQLQAYQRLLHLVPPDHPELAQAMLKAGLHSALQIVALPKSQFLADYAHLTPDTALLETCYQQALSIRAQLLLHFVQLKQQSTI